MHAEARAGHGAEYIASEAAAQKAAAPLAAAPAADFPSFTSTFDSGAGLPAGNMAPADSCPGALDSTARLLDLCTRRRLAWLDEQRLWERVSFLVDDGSWIKPATADCVADAAAEWQAAVAARRGLDAAIELEVAARRVDRSQR